MVSFIVKKRMGTEHRDGFVRMRRQTSIPERVGMAMSRMAMSGGVLCNCSRASAPVRAEVT